MKTTTAIGQLLKDSRDWRTFFKRCANTSAFRLRAQAWQFREEIAERGFVVAELGTVQDALFELARDLFPHSPGADFVTWAGLLCGDAMARMQEHYQALSAVERAAVDISGAWCHNDAIEEARRNENLAALREALEDYEREACRRSGRGKKGRREPRARSRLRHRGLQVLEVTRTGPLGTRSRDRSAARPRNARC